MRVYIWPWYLTGIPWLALTRTRSRIRRRYDDGTRPPQETVDQWFVKLSFIEFLSGDQVWCRPRGRHLSLAPPTWFNRNRPTEVRFPIKGTPAKEWLIADAWGLVSRGISAPRYQTNVMQWSFLSAEICYCSIKCFSLLHWLNRERWKTRLVD